MSSKVDRFELMRLFVRIVEAGSVSAAGRLLGLSQPSASRQLKQLETMLGAQLVQRSTHELMLTDAGEKFFTSAVDLLANWDNAAETAQSGRDELKGPIRVAVPVAIGQTVLADLASKFILEHPGITLDWRLVDEPGDLAAEGYDLWIRAGPIADESLIVHDLRKTERTIVAGPDHQRIGHPSELSRLNAVQLVTYVSRNVTLETADGRSITIGLRPSFATDNIYAALTAVRRGVGYGILPYWVVQKHLEAGNLFELCPDWHPPAISLRIAYPQTRFRPARAKLLIEYLRRELHQKERGFDDGRIEVSPLVEGIGAEE